MNQGKGKNLEQSSDLVKLRIWLVSLHVFQHVFVYVFSLSPFVNDIKSTTIILCFTVLSIPVKG